MFNLYQNDIRNSSKLREKVNQAYRLNETECVQNLLSMVSFSQAQDDKARELATKLVNQVRSKRARGVGVDVLMQEFKLSTDEGIALMCLAESLLRIPDKQTQDDLIQDKIAKGNWANHIKSGKVFVNFASWGLLIAGKIIKPSQATLTKSLNQLIARGGEPLVRKSMQLAVKFMGNQFVMAEDIQTAIESSHSKELKGYKFSYDMLGEAAMTDEDALLYMQSYENAIKAVGIAGRGRGVHHSSGVSVKLSAIYPRYQRSKYTDVMGKLYPRLKQLFVLANQYQIGLFIDAEEAERLEISLDLLERLLNEPELKDFKGIGFVVQSYQRRAIYVIDFLAELSRTYNNRLMVRLVKGAYWDSEIKRAQVDGQTDYPVFTRKFYTDLSYIVCAQRLFDYQQEIYPLFATHNAYTLAMVYQIGIGRNYEFQCLYGMGETLYDNVVGEVNLGITCRVYAPVGTYDTLLAYLVRRLLENGANSSFVYQIMDKNVPIEDLIVNPIKLAKQVMGEANPYFTSPMEIYPDGRVNSKGIDLTDELLLKRLQDELSAFAVKQYRAHPLIIGYKAFSSAKLAMVSPQNKNDIVGEVVHANIAEVETAIVAAQDGFMEWSQCEPVKRAQTLVKLADLLEANSSELLALLVRESGKTLLNANAEIREAVDFCRYYALQAKDEFANNTHHALGIMVCISPWNFPLAIFIGEISSALVAGNSVIAKPSEQTSLVAFYAVELFYQAGVPQNVLQLLPGDGAIIGDALTRDERIHGVIFTGSTEVAKMINQNLATRSFNPVLIAETGGQNVMIVDSSALPEQVVTDVLASGFDSAGQRCSALRVLYLQNDIADKITHMLKGAMQELRVGDPKNLATDVGPVIDKDAQEILLKHIDTMRKTDSILYQTPLTNECSQGVFVAPTLIEIKSINDLKREVFGPIVHVARYDSNQLDQVIADINASGYGLTQGVHSRIENTINKLYQGIHAGNIYVNRNMVGAVVGVQPFGGEGLSGTGPKAGGPFYLNRLVNTSVNPRLTLLPAQICDFGKLNTFVDQFYRLNLSKNELNTLLDYVEQVKQQTLIGKQINLPGPTGENNFMFFTKRGVVACLATNKDDYLHQIICALASDNDVVLPNSEVTRLIAALAPDYISIAPDVAKAPKLNLAIVSKDYPNLVNLRTSLAKRDGAIALCLIETDKNVYPLNLLVCEKTVSINVTATGGNAVLMSIKDDVKL